MEAQDVLADKMERGPELLEPDGALALFITVAQRRDVVYEGVEPNVNRVRRITGNENAPALSPMAVTVPIRDAP